jgi:hypothetical protein
MQNSNEIDNLDEISSPTSLTEIKFLFSSGLDST